MRQIMLDMNRMLTVPPEYDKNDSKWTLKYREPAPKLVELLKHSDVYVNADKLAECKKESGDSSKLYIFWLHRCYPKSSQKVLCV